MADDITRTSISDGYKRIEEVANDVRSLDRKLSDFQQSVAETNSRFGARIGKLEAHNDVQDEQVRQIKETQVEIRREIRESQKEQKDAFSGLRMEHKESMIEIKSALKDITDTVSPMVHKLDTLSSLKHDVEEMKGKDGKVWNNIKDKTIGFIIGGILVMIATVLGVSQFFH